MLLYISSINESTQKSSHKSGSISMSSAKNTSTPWDIISTTGSFKTAVLAGTNVTSVYVGSPNGYNLE